MTASNDDTDIQGGGEDVTIPPAGENIARLPGSSNLAAEESETLAQRPVPGQEDKTYQLDDGLATLASLGESELSNVQYFGDYELLKEIARGGMGVVYEARQVNLNRLVALKMILSGQLASEEDVARFYLEAEAAANLDHPGIVPIYEIGQHEGQHFFTMGFVEGQSLQDRIKDGPLLPQEAAELTAKVTEAIGYAHEKGVIHRDLKPANVLLDKKGEPKVTDFGLARKLEQDSGLTKTGAVMGTPSYMPPEQAAGNIEAIDHRADIYSLGGILYALLTGRPPFQAANPLDTLLQVLEKEPVPPRQLAPKVPRDIETIALKALEKDPKRRYQTAQEMADDLRCFLAGEPIRARSITAVERAWRSAKRHPVVSVLGSLAALLLLIVSIGGPLAAMQQSRLKGLAEDREAEALASKRVAEEAAAKERQAREQLAVEKEQALANLYATSIRLAQQEWQGSKITRVEQLLNECPPQFRDWEWHYLQSLVHGAEVSLRGHTGQVDFVGFQEDGLQLISHATDQQVKIWNLPSRQQIDSKTAPNVFKSSFGGGHRLMAQPSGRELRIVEIASGKVVSRVPLPDNAASLDKAVLSADGSTLALQFIPSSEDGSSRLVHVIDLQAGHRLCELKGVNGEGQHAPVLSRDGKWFAGALGPNIIGIWETQSGTLIHSLAGHVLPITSIQFNHDATQLVSGGFEGVAKLWDLNTGKEQLTLLGHVDWVLGVRFSDDGKWVVSAGKDRTARIWDASSGSELVTIRGNTSYVLDATLSPDNNFLATAAADQVIRVWNVENLTSIEESIPKDDFDALLTQFDVTSNHRAKVLDGLRRMVYDHASQEWKSHYGHRGPLTDVDFFPGSNQFVTAGRDDRLLLWSTQQTTPLKAFDTPGRALDVATAPDGKTFAAAVSGAGGDHSVFVWHTDSAEPVLKLEGPNDEAIRVAISPDGKYLAAGGASTRNQTSGNVEIIIWELETGTEVQRIAEHRGIVQALAFSNDSRSVLAADTAGVTARWAIDAEAKEPLWKMGVNTTGIAFHPHRDVFASTHVDGRIRIWNATTQQRLADLEGPLTALVKLAYSPDGRRLVSCGDDAAITVWDPETHLKLLEMKGHSNTVFGVAFSPDGRYIASAGYDGTVNIWDSGRSLANGQSEWPIIMQERFEDTDELTANWRPQTGKWAIEDGQLVGVLGTVEQPGVTFSAALIDHQQRLPEDVEVEFDFMSTEPTGIEAGFYDGDEHALEVELLSVENPFLLMKGALIWTRMGGNNYGQHGVNKAFEMPVGERVRVRLRREGEAFTAFVNDMEVTQVRIQTRRLPYLLFQGIYGPSGSKFYIDNIVIRAPEWGSEQLLAEELVDKLFAELLLAEDVRNKVENNSELSAEMKQFALAHVDSHPPASPRALAERGRVVAESADRTEEDLRLAIRFFQDAVRQAPMNGYFNTLLGEASFELGDYQTALESLETAAELRRNQRGSASPNQMAMLAVCHHELGNAAQAGALAQQFDDCMRFAHWKKQLEQWQLASKTWLHKLQLVPRPERSAEVEEVLAAVFAAQEAFMVDRNLDAYFQMCEDNYTRIAANWQTKSPNDRRFTGQAAKDIVSLWLRRPPERDATEVLPQQISVSINGDSARVDLRIVRVQGTQFIDFGHQLALVRKQGHWKLRGTRSWHHRALRSSSVGVIEYSPEYFLDLNEKLPSEPLPTREHILQCIRARKFDVALELAQQLTAAEPDNPNHWLDLWAAAEGAGNVSEGLRGLTSIVSRAPNATLFLDESVRLMAVAGRETEFVDFIKQLPVQETTGWLLRTRALRLYFQRVVQLGRLLPEDAMMKQQQLIGELAAQEGVDEAGLRQLEASLATTKSWRLVGAFAANSGQAALNKPFLLERYHLGLTSKEEEELQRKTKRVEVSIGEYINLLSAIERTSNVAAFGVVSIDSPIEQEAMLLVGSDDGVKIWLNEEVVHEFNGGRAFSATSDHVPVKLQAGENVIMVKVSQDAGEWGFALELVDKKGLPIP
ncbi:protein kinase domain-containing protein [Planctomycetaceae bacterium SH139]